jgi:hypothetical protein
LNFTEEQILALAPDDASKKAGRDLANPSKWVSKGANDNALWGECQGSGSKPYQTQIDLSDIAFKCSCPSRKFPCKHGLGLMLLYCRQQNIFTEKTAPAWVADWLNKRIEKQEKQSEKTDKPVDEAAQLKRQQARNQKVSDGAAELLLWIKDIIRNGILLMPQKDFAWFEHMAKRMVDAQAPGLAAMIRNLGQIDYYADGWQTLFLEHLLNIYMTIEAYRRVEHFDENFKQDIRSLIGFSINQDELRGQNGVDDTWLVIGKQVTELDNLTTERNWLYGLHSRKYALVLQFIVRGQVVPLALTPGMYLKAELIFFPSVVPMRAIIKVHINTDNKPQVKAFENWQQVIAEETNNCSKMPVRAERPYIIHSLRPVQYNSSWWLQDDDKNMMALKNANRQLLKLLSLSGGRALDMVVTGKENNYTALAVWHEGIFKPIHF